ncbi:MAG: hypothetical protein M5R41_18900 [Bacteroidia bacterium]|nr:hypothetical protein [Bacteroidia bacterium]
MNVMAVVSSLRKFAHIALLSLLLPLTHAGALYAQRGMSAGLFVGRAEPERHVIWHGLKDSTVRGTGICLGAVFTMDLLPHLTLAVTPQYSEIYSGYAHVMSGLPKPRQGYIEASTPPLHAMELPVSIRAGTEYLGFRPYVAVGVTLGYAFRDDAHFIQQDYSSGPDRQLDVVYTEPVRQFHTAVQAGLGISADVWRGYSLWFDWSLTKHLNDPIQSELVTWEAPLRGIWRFGFTMPLAGDMR